MRQVVSNRVPDDVQVDFEMAVRQGIAHFIRGCKRSLRVFPFEFRGVSRNIAASLSDDLEISNDGVLNQRVGLEIRLIQGMAIAGNSVNGDKDVANAVRHTVAFPGHSGRA